MRKLSGFHSPGSSMAYPQGYLYQPSASLALYSCPAYSTSVISGPRTEELGRSSSGSAFAPYAGSTAFSSASPGYNSHLPYSADAAAAATFTSYVVSKLKVIIHSLTSSKKATLKSLQRVKCLVWEGKCASRRSAFTQNR